MLIPQEAHSEAAPGQGRPGVSLAELRRGLARPSAMSQAYRQRLLELARRASRVQALGGEYAGICLSESAQAALGCLTASH